MHHSGRLAASGAFGGMDDRFGVGDVHSGRSLSRAGVGETVRGRVANAVPVSLELRRRRWLRVKLGMRRHPMFSRTDWFAMRFFAMVSCWLWMCISDTAAQEIRFC